MGEYLEDYRKPVEDLNALKVCLLSPPGLCPSLACCDSPFADWLVNRVVVISRIELCLGVVLLLHPIGIPLGQFPVIEPGLYQFFEVPYLARLELTVDKNAVGLGIDDMGDNLFDFPFGEKVLVGNFLALQQRRSGQSLPQNLVLPFPVQVPIGLSRVLIEDNPVFLLIQISTKKTPPPIEDLT